MGRLLRRRLTYANVAATLALFIALGGTSVAALKLGRNSVKTKNIASGAVKSRNIAKSAVTSPKIKDGAVGTLDLSSEARASLRGSQGPKGDQGAPGVSEFALVSEGGTLAGGTATSAQRAGQGDYRVSFGRDVSKCAASANPAFFSGASSTANRISVKLSIGFDGGTPAANTISASTYTSSGGSTEDTSFSLLVAC